MRIALLGFGTVGSHFYKLCEGRSDLQITAVLSRRPRPELTCTVTADYDEIVRDPSIDIVVEVMGGLHPAYEYVAAALRAGKDVVSSNKYLMCRYYDELNALAREHGAALRCTAAVGGGIPWLTNLEKAARANHISRVWGILNGTTNYIMDAMHSSDMDFADVLAQAQALGYAEADPSADIDGLDIQRKLILSANVAFGVSLREADVPVSGIRNVRKADIARFQAHDCTCKLIATAEQRGGSISAYVEPTLLGSDALEAAVPANFNLISMDGDRMGVQSFFGQGAGRYPTAYNVVQDLVDITRGVHAFYTDSFVPAVPDNAGVQHRYYVRTRAALPELATLAEGDWDGAVITQPVPVSRMHALMAQALEQDGESFFAALQ